MATKAIQVHHDFQGSNQIKNVLIDVRSSDPGSPAEGQFWYNSSTHVLKYKDNGSIQTLGTSSGVANAFSTITDGSTPQAASGADTFTVAASGTGVSVNTTTSKTLTVVLNSAATSGANKVVLAGAGGLISSTFMTGVLAASDLTNGTVGSGSIVLQSYVDTAIQGTPTKATAAYATTTTLPANTYSNGTSGVGATLTGNSNGALSTTDGQSPALNDIVLVKNEATASHNGLFTLTQLGDGSHPYILTRHVDMDSSAEFSGAVIAVENGTVNAGSLWICAINAPTVGTTSITLTEMNKAADLAAGTGISLSGNTISINTSWAGQSAITTVGTLTTGALGTGFTAVAVAQGGTGQSTAANARGTSGLGSQTAPTSATNVTIAAAGIPTMVKATLTGTGSATSFTVTHNLSNLQPIIQLMDSSGNAVDAGIQATDANNVVITFNTAPTNASTWLVTVIG